MIVSPLRCSYFPLQFFSISCFSSFLLFLSQICCSRSIHSSPACLFAQCLFLLVFLFCCFLSVSVPSLSSARMSALLLYCNWIRKLLLCCSLFLHNPPSLASSSCIFFLLFVTTAPRFSLSLAFFHIIFWLSCCLIFAAVSTVFFTIADAFCLFYFKL